MSPLQGTASLAVTRLAESPARALEPKWLSLYRVQDYRIAWVRSAFHVVATDSGVSDKGGNNNTSVACLCR
jgi:hypothetical protein